MSDWKQPWECSRCGALSMHWLDESEEACECLNCDRNAKADSSGDLHEIAELKAEIEHLRERDTDFQRRLKGQEREIERLRNALEDIERKGHGDYHARGYSLANIAGEALRDE